MLFFFFFKQKTAYEMRISDWSSDVCSSDLRLAACRREVELNRRLSTDVYLGVADVLDSAGEPCEHVLVMRRMPADRRLSTLVLEGAPVEEALDDLEIGRAHVCHPVPNAHLVCRLLLDKQTQTNPIKTQ